MRVCLAMLLMLLVAGESIADETETEYPQFVYQAIDLLEGGRVFLLSAAWPRESSTPETCVRFATSIRSPQESFLDGSRARLIADLERAVVWVEIIRGLDGYSEFRGPMKIEDGESFSPVSHESLPSCLKSETPDAD